MINMVLQRTLEMKTINRSGSTGGLDSQRVILRDSINQVAAEVEVALREAGIDFPVYVVVPSSGAALAQYFTPIDPTDDDWKRVSAIVCGIIANCVACERLRGRELPCAIANAHRITASELSERTAGDDSA
jgi:hypothetical protein